jgi:replicative DNA helicase
MNHLPNDIASERGVLGSVLIDPDIFKTLDLSKDDFYQIQNKSIYEAFTNISERDEPIDYIVVCQELRKLNSDVTSSELAQLMSETPSSMNYQAYAKIVKNMSAKRSMLNIFTAGASACLNGKEPNEIRTSVEIELNKVSAVGKVDNHTYDMKVASKHALEATELASTGVRCINTGLTALDTLINVQKGELITVAAPTSQGKTALLATIVLNSARMGRKWQVFCLEGGHVRFTQRLWSQISGVEYWRIMTGKVSDEETPAFFAAVAELENLPILVTDIPNIKIGQIRREALKRDVDGIAVDYAQLVSPDKFSEKRHLDVGEVSRGLSALAVEKDIPIFMAAQLDRTIEKRADKKPMLSDLRESGSLEQDSATVIMIYRPDEYNEELVELLVNKHRNGKKSSKLDQVFAQFIPKTVRFEDVTAKVETVRLNYQDKD